MQIRLATDADHDAVWDIFSRVIKTGETYVFSPDTKREDLPKLWFAPTMKTYVAEEGGRVVGTYFIKPNQLDLGSHVANTGYMVHPDAHGRGIGRKLCEHSLEVAREMGFKSMQFNFVVSTNKVAVRLWQKCGFRIIGTIPNGFNHLKRGFVDAYIMFREV